MNIHEYQARELLERFGVPIPRGGVAETPAQAVAVAHSMPGERPVVKAQIHAGGRGKGSFLNGFQGGVRVCKDAGEVREVAGKMLGQTLVTPQTGPAGRMVNRVLVVEAKPIERELYFAILLDRAHECPVVIASQRGGMDIEAVAHETPEQIFKEFIDPALGFQSYQARKLAKKLALNGMLLQPACKCFHALYRLFIESDCSLVEVNPLVVTKDGAVLALDAKLNFDDNALCRHPNILEYRDTAEEDPREVQASRFNLNYIGLDGNIGCLVNGAGLAMATMDIVKYSGANPANFLDVGGGANEQQVTEAFKILGNDPNVKAILVNIFGGIMKCDIIAQGLINAFKVVKLSVPLVVRLEGTNVEAGKKLLKDSNLPIEIADGLDQAAQMVTAAVMGEK